MFSTTLQDPAFVLRLMIDGTLPYDAKATHDLAIAAAGGAAKAVLLTPELVELSFQMEALALARDMRQSDGLIQMFQASATLALLAIVQR